MRTLFVLAAVAALAFAASGDVALGFVADANLTDASGNFKFRYTGDVHLDVPGVVDLLLWSSVSVDAATADAKAKASADVMLGAGALPTIATPAFAILASASGEAAISVDPVTFARNLFSASASLDANFKGGVIGMAALSMQEVDADNKPVGKLIPLVASLLNPCIDQEINGDNGNLTGLYCTFKAGDAEVTTTFVTSKKAGILEYGHTPVSPRSYELIVEVKDFKLDNTKNHVRMDIGLLTASGAADVKGSASVVHREGHDDIYAVASNYAVVDKERVSVDVKVQSGSADMGDLAEGILKVALGGNVDAQIAQVHFPAGATNFIYDPAVGAGSNVYEAGAASLALSVFVALLCVFAYLF